jgi:hypothetical protein
MTFREKLEAVAKILKRRFPNLGVQEVIALAADIVEATEDKY